MTRFDTNRVLEPNGCVRDLTDREVVKALYQLFKRLFRSSDVYERPIICTPYGGVYGPVTGWVLVMQGTPPRGVILVDLSYDYPSGIFSIDGAKSRRLSDKQNRDVKAFYNRMLRHRHEAVSLQPNGKMEPYELHPSTEWDPRPLE